MKITIAGGTGFVGTHLIDALVARGHNLMVLSSRTGAGKKKSEQVEYIKANTIFRGKWQESISDSDIIINLAGRSIFHLWTDAYKEKMYSSRVHTTRNIVEILQKEKTRLLLNASAAGYYGDSGEKERIESDGAGDDFLAEICAKWEEEAFFAEKKGIRVMSMRFGVVLGKNGGAYATMKTPFLFGVGGPIGNGKQFFPWIHIDDLVAAILFLIDNEQLNGPCNFVAPDAVRQFEFASALGAALKRPAFLPAPGFMLRTILGEFGSSLLGGQKVVPKLLEENGFHFAYPRLADALKEIVHG